MGKEDSMNSMMILATASASGVLTDDMITVITNGFNSLQGTVSQVLTVAVPASVAIIALTSGVKYALKKVRAVISSAA